MHEILKASYEIPCCVSFALVVVQGFRALIHDLAVWLIQKPR
jgi:hypothetical protein